MVIAPFSWQRSSSVSDGHAGFPRAEAEPSLLALLERVPHDVLDIDTVLKTSLEGDYAPNCLAVVAV